MSGNVTITVEKTALEFKAVILLVTSKYNIKVDHVEKNMLHAD